MGEDLLIYTLMGLAFTVVAVKVFGPMPAREEPATEAKDGETPVVLPEIPEARDTELPVFPEPEAVAPVAVVPEVAATAAPEPFAAEALAASTPAPAAGPGRLRRAASATAAAFRAILRWRREQRIAAAAVASRRLQVLKEQHRAELVSRPRVYRGDTIKVATTYRVFAEGAWHHATWVVEQDALAAQGTDRPAGYWLAGDPEQNPEIMGYLVDRRALPLSKAVH